MKTLVLSTLFMLAVLIVPSGAGAAVMNDYCQVPAFISNMVPPNVLLLVDASLSMGYDAYQQASDRQRFCDGMPSQECDPDHDHDCVRNWGTCSDMHDGHLVCSGDHDRRCTSNTDCTRNWGTCTATRTDLSYGNCSQNINLECQRNADCGLGNSCVARQVFEGYFRPDKSYVKNADNVYYEYVPAGLPCTTLYTYKCYSGKNKCSPKTTIRPVDALNTCNTSYCTNQRGNPTSTTGDCGNDDSGNLLNYLNMSRMDLLRWAMTGGSPKTCRSPHDYKECDPRMYNYVSDNGLNVPAVCKENLPLNSVGTITGKGCILESTNGSLVAVPWYRVEEGLTFQFQTLPVQPRMGVMFFGGTAVAPNHVFIGEFTGAESREAYRYQGLMTEVNGTAPGEYGWYTPTAPAMWDALNYFSQVTPDYGGINASTSNKWESPMYDCADGSGSNCRYIPCAQNFVLLMSDGLWNRGGNPVSATCSIDTGYEASSADPVVASYKMHMGFTNAVTNVSTKVNGVYAVGMFVGTEGERALQNTAMYGSFDNSSKTWPSDRADYPKTSCNITDTGAACANGRGSNCTAMPPSSTDWDKNGDGKPDTYFVADDALSIRSNILDAVLDMLSKVTSGTAASVLASGEGSGANLAQAIYYPRRSFYSGAADWVGGLQNFWYFVDPMFSYSNIREEGGATKDYILDLLANGTSDTKKDYIMQFYYDTAVQQAKAKRYYDTTGTGASGTLIDIVDFESLGNLWEAGKMLWARDPADRAIYTPIDTTKALTAAENKLAAFASPGVNNVASLRPLLNTDASILATENDELAARIVNWVRGADQSAYTYTSISGPATENYRTRTVALDASSGTGVWKLGDIIDSTPRISSWVPLHTYDQTYGDTTYYNFITDKDSTLPASSTERYRNRGTVFVGANDGMLHAFKLGRLGLKWNSQTASQKATLKYCSLKPSQACAVDTDCGAGEGTCTTDTDLGKELWAFIPRNMLPYLKFIKENDYCHLYGVDLTSYVFDASIGIDTTTVAQPLECTSSDYWRCKKTSKSWKTILLGGMRYGGACRNMGVACNSGTDCVNTPVNGVGYSSYFALDVTDPYVPKLLWEFSDPQLGFATSGPTVVRIKSRTAKADGTSEADTGPTNGRWFVVFGSGPTGPIETSEHQFMGRSDQNLRLFVLDLKTGQQLLQSTDTGIQYGFAGSMLNATHDSNLDYQDDALYVGYAKKCTALSSSVCTSGAWNDGGILRILTRADDLKGDNLAGSGACDPTSMTALNPNCWLTTKVMDGIGPVTSAIVRLQNRNTGTLWLYGGTGRYFFKTSTATDDGPKPRNIFGFKEPCFFYDTVNGMGRYRDICTDSNAGNDPNFLTLDDLTSVNLSSTAGATTDPNAEAFIGWNIAMDPADSTYDAERVITDPLSTTLGTVFFTTNKPYISSCTTGGKTSLWAVRYDTGAAPGATLKGKALIQVSTGSIEQIDLATAFTQKGQRRTDLMEGVPPTAQGLSIISSPPPVKRVLHMKER